MEEGYLVIETHAEHPRLVRVRKSETTPAEPVRGDQTDPRVRYIARFSDLSAAQMQTHARLRHHLVDVETGLYRCDPAIAVAAAQSLELRHRQIYLDPDLAEDEALGNAAAMHRRRHGLAERIWQAVGILAVVLLLVKLLLGL
jgi:hypothetical protein